MRTLLGSKPSHLPPLGVKPLGYSARPSWTRSCLLPSSLKASQRELGTLLSRCLCSYWAPKKATCPCALLLLLPFCPLAGVSVRRPRPLPPPLHEPLASAAVVSLVHRCQAGTSVGGGQNRHCVKTRGMSESAGHPAQPQTTLGEQRNASWRNMLWPSTGAAVLGGCGPYKQLTPFRKPEELCAKENTYPMGPRTQELHFQGPFDTEGSIFTKTCVRICDAAWLRIGRPANNLSAWRSGSSFNPQWHVRNTHRGPPSPRTTHPCARTSANNAKTTGYRRLRRILMLLKTKPQMRK